MVGHDHEVMQPEFSRRATYERSKSTNSIALRSDCNNLRPMLVLVVTENVRAELRTALEPAWRTGMAIHRG